MSGVSIQQALTLAMQHRLASRSREAEAICEQILAIQPTHPDALHLLGVLRFEAGELQQSADLLRRAIESNPRVFDYWWSLGRLFSTCAQWGEAAAALNRATAINPNSAMAWLDLGNALQLSGQWFPAVGAYERSIALQPDRADSRNNLGNLLNELGQNDLAIEHLKRAIELQPEYPEAQSNLGNAYQSSGRLDEAIAAYRQATAARADWASAWNNLASALHAKGLFDESTQAYEKALSLDPKLAEAMSGLGTVKLGQLQVDQAIDSYRQAVAERPEFAEARHNLGLALLLKGDFQNGWQEFEWRRRIKDAPRFTYQLNTPEWDGQPLDGKTLFLHTEQGFGDAIQFVRYFPQVVKSGGCVILGCRPELIELFHQFEGIESLVARDQPVPEHDVQFPLMSLPRLFGTTLETIPNDGPYLKADAQRATRWRDRIGAQGGAKKIGLAWKGRSTHIRDRNRSMNLDQLAPILAMPKAKFFSLQIGGESDERLVDYTKDLTDFAETAGLIDQLDLVICVDTAVAHLAGAMGKPVWVLLPHWPDWRWMLGRDDSPWYPTMRLFRQETREDWSVPVNRIVESLR